MLFLIAVGIGSVAASLAVGWRPPLPGGSPPVARADYQGRSPNPAIGRAPHKVAIYDGADRVWSASHGSAADSSSGSRPVTAPY